ncbi:MAG: hypothetical protein FI695_06875 [SAR202 cluster bacterium]|nr:hypothetical protein [Chloroflexota bacterium]MQG51683.1 hypothetical protein [SAR202 cluster bacterium]
MLNKITGIIIWTDQLDIMVDFYKNLLGLTVHSIRPSFVSFDIGGERFNIGTHNNVSGMAKDPYRIMLNFEVDDIIEVSKKLRAKNVSFLREPEEEHWGGMVATFYDPDGNILQLLQKNRLN